MRHSRVNNDTQRAADRAASDTINWGTPLSLSNDSSVIRKNNGVPPIKSLRGIPILSRRTKFSRHLFLSLLFSLYPFPSLRRLEKIFRRRRRRNFAFYMANK